MDFSHLKLAVIMSYCLQRHRYTDVPLQLCLHYYDCNNNIIKHINYYTGVHRLYCMVARI